MPVVTPKYRLSTTPPLTAPLDSARHAPGTGRGLQTIDICAGKCFGYVIPAATRLGGGQIEQSRSGNERPFTAVSPVLCVSFSWRASEPARLSRAFFRRASGKRSDA